MKVSTGPWTIAASLLQKEPVIFVRFRNASVYTDADSTPIAVDFSTGPVMNETTPKLQYLRVTSFSPSSITPEQGQSSTGRALLQIIDPSEEALFYLSEAAGSDQIRPGTRAEIYSGFRSIDEADYMIQATMEVVQRRMADDHVSFDIELADTIRDMDVTAFQNTDRDNPLTLGPAHPFDIFLQVALSSDTINTGNGFNVLGANGAGIRESKIDTTQFQVLRDKFPNDQYKFVIRGPENFLRWATDQIFKSVNAYPLVNQYGQLSASMYIGYA